MFLSPVYRSPLPFLRGGGVRTQATILLVKRIKMIGMLLNFSQRRMSPKKGNQKKHIYWYNKDVCRASKALHFY